MSVICQCVDGAFLDHNLYVQSYLKCDCKNTGYKLKDEFFSVESPFMMDSQAERIRREANCKHLGHEVPTKQTSADKKRRKKASKLMSFEPHNQKIYDLIDKCLVSLITQAREINHLRTISQKQEVTNNVIARKASLIQGCGDLFQTLCEHFDEIFQVSENYDAVLLCEGLSLSAASVINRYVKNLKNHCILCKVEDHDFIIPGRSSFLTSSFQQFLTRGHQLITVEGGYDLIVIDPPWTNKSVKRKKSYNMIDEEDLKQIPLQDLAKVNGLICVWVTNNESLLQFVKDELFPHWSVAWVANWIWIKVTRYGEPICQINTHHKKPYEQIIIGRVQSSKQNLSSISCDKNQRTSNREDFFRQSQNPQICVELEQELPLNIVIDCMGDRGVRDEQQDLKQTCPAVAHVGSTCDQIVCTDGRPECKRLQSGLPRNSEGTDSCTEQHGAHKTSSLNIPSSFVLSSVPCSLHSKKPPLSDILMPYLPLAPKNLELFARNLTSGWCSWGNEVSSINRKFYYICDILIVENLIFTFYMSFMIATFLIDWVSN
ncbi:unnamed protein product [Lymnaea stagnalis]|uniref:Methyltransferase-like protein 4 n=1 Tax=Lymnaea stagnalis TaxID=6523 RepID=A0AAV2HGI1_LYMST